MFKFGFSDKAVDDKPQIELNTNTLGNQTIQWKVSEEIFIGNNVVDAELMSDDNDYVLRTELENDFVIRHVSTEIVAEIIRRAHDAEDSIFKADQADSDLVTAVYEGGLKIWQCTYDLLNYLYQNRLNFNGKKVLDLGCGAGILGLYAYKQGANVYFQDYNTEVLKYVTIPNVMLNNREGTAKPRECRFYSGDWDSFVDVTKEEMCHNDKLFDVIFTSETIYNCDNYTKLNNLFKKMLKSTGVIYLAAKTVYFGIGGNLRCFEDMLKADNMFNIEKLWQNKDGVQREIISLRFKLY